MVTPGSLVRGCARPTHTFRTGYQGTKRIPGESLAAIELLALEYHNSTMTKKEVTMKKNLFVPRRLTILFSLVALATTAQLLYAEERDRDDGQSCSLATLKGRYQFASSGFVIDATET